jgi:hypothetical protein
MLYSEIIAVCSQIHTKHKCAVWAEFLCAFAKLRKATVSFVMSVRPSVCFSVRRQQLSTDIDEI